MEIQNLYRTAGGNRANLRELLAIEYKSTVEDQAQRLLGAVPAGLVDRVLEQTQQRIFSVPENCDALFLVFDCLRKEVFCLLREQDGLKENASCSLLREYVPCEEIDKSRDSARYCAAVLH